MSGPFASCGLGSDALHLRLAQHQLRCAATIPSGMQDLTTWARPVQRRACFQSVQLARPAGRLDQVAGLSSPHGDGEHGEITTASRELPQQRQQQSPVCCGQMGRSQPPKVTAGRTACPGGLATGGRAAAARCPACLRPACPALDVAAPGPPHANEPAHVHLKVWACM